MSNSKLSEIENQYKSLYDKMTRTIQLTTFELKVVIKFIGDGKTHNFDVLLNKLYFHNII